jgi:hypothetical protein
MPRVLLLKRLLHYKQYENNHSFTYGVVIYKKILYIINVCLHCDHNICVVNNSV